MDTWRDAFGDLLVGSRCAGCGSPGRRLCPTCASTLYARPRLAWPDPVPTALTVAPYAGASYEGPLRQLIVAYKEDARFGLARPLGRMLADVVEHQCAARDVRSARVALVPVPSRPDAVRRRGHDHMLRLARVGAGILRRRGHDVTVEPLLRQAPGVTDQAGLSALERSRNLDGSLCFRGQPSRSRVAECALVVVDDVITTGASVAAALTALSRAGHPAAGVATVAATARRWPSSTAACG